MRIHQKCFKNLSNLLKTFRMLYEIYKKQFETRKRKSQLTNKSLTNAQKN